MKKKLIMLLAVAMLATSLASCGGGADKTDGTTTATDGKKTEVTTTDKKEEKKPAFEGEIGDILDSIVAKAGEIEGNTEYGIKSISCYHNDVDTDSCETILGLSEEKFKEYVDAAIESKPDGSWFTHSVVVVRLKGGVNVEEAAKTIVANTEATRFGCLRPQKIVGMYTGNYVIFTTSDEEICENVYKAVEALSGDSVVRIDRDKNWSDSGLG